MLGKILIVLGVVVVALLLPRNSHFVSASSEPVLVGAGDIASCASDGDEKTAELLDDIDGTVFTLGDNAYGKGTADQFRRCYGKSWGHHKDRTRPSLGNHDYETPNASGYFGYFGSAAGDPQKGYYSYELGGWQVIVLNTICSNLPGRCSSTSPQATWLKRTLANNPADCTIAYFHNPRFSSGENGNTRNVTPFWEILYKAEADVVLSGHEHDYERFAPQTPDGRLDENKGIRQFVVGTGGAENRPFGTPADNSQVRIEDTDGVLKLTLRESSYDWQFISVDEGVEDSGSADCS